MKHWPSMTVALCFTHSRARSHFVAHLYRHFHPFHTSSRDSFSFAIPHSRWNVKFPLIFAPCDPFSKSQKISRVRKERERELGDRGMIFPILMISKDVSSLDMAITGKLFMARYPFLCRLFLPLELGKEEREGKGSIFLLNQNTGFIGVVTLLCHWSEMASIFDTLRYISEWGCVFS